MSLFNALRTSVSGLNAQSNALGVISDNIANSATTGYKEANAQFETLLASSGATGTYESGGVQTDVRYGVTDQGTLATTTSATDLAITGNGFFPVSQNGDNSYLTRAGSFVPDSNGNLINAAGFSLLGYQIGPDGTPSSTLSIVNVSNSNLQYAPTTAGTLAVNLPSTATAVPTTTTTDPQGNTTTTQPTPGTTNSASTQYTDKTSLTVYDDLGTADNLDVYYTKTGTDTWEVTAYKQSDASANGGFPYASSNLGSVNVTFDPATGNFASGSPTTLNVSLNGNSIPVSLTGTTQLATAFGVNTASANGNAPSKVSGVTIGTDGTVTEDYSSGAQIATYKIPLATVQSPDNLTSVTGNVYQQSSTSGNVILETAGTNGAGVIKSDSLEQSTVDLATELSNLVTVQRAYEANSKVLQAASDLLGNLNQIQTN